MKRDAVTPADLRRSVIAVPPLAIAPDGGVSASENARIMTWLSDGGVSSIMYGGNANFFHLPLKAYAAILDMLADLAPADAWILPAIGPDFGKALEQAPLVRERGFPAPMMLPSSAPTTPKGVAEGVRRLSDAFEGPVVLYLKAEDYVSPADLAALLDEGRIAAVKYAVVRADPATDPYLEAIVSACGTERIVSGIGERPVIEHWRLFGLRAFTSGSICVGPRSGMALLAALKSDDYAEATRLRARFLALEDLRDQHSPIRILHAAVEAAGIARTGELAPYLSNIDEPAVLHAVAAAAQALSAFETGQAFGPRVTPKQSFAH